MKRSDLYREWARVQDMCEGSGTSSLLCVRRNGKCDFHEFTIGAFHDTDSEYSFAQAIVEGRPAFVGDVLFCEDDTTIVVRGVDKRGVLIADCSNGKTGALYTIDFVSWNPPLSVRSLEDRITRIENHLGI